MAKKGGLAYYVFKAIPKIHHEFYKSAFFVNISNGDLTTRLAYGVSAFHDIALSTTLQNDREVRGRFASGSLQKNYLLRTFVFPLLFSVTNN